MKSYKTEIRSCAILLASVLAVSCNDSTDTQSNSNTPVVTTSAKPTVALTSEQVDAVVGESFTLDISMSDFPVSEGGGVSVQFDASLLNVSDVTINSATWDFVNKIGNIDNNAGVVSDILFSSYDGISGNSNIVTITFEAINSGLTQIALTGSSINPFASDGDTVTATFIPTTVQIAAVATN